MICTFGYPTSKSNSDVTTEVNEFFLKKFKKFYIENSAIVIDRNSIACKILVNFNCHYTDIQKVEKKFLNEIISKFGEYPSIRFLDEYDTYTIIYEIHNPEEKESKQ